MQIGTFIPFSTRRERRASKLAKRNGITMKQARIIVENTPSPEDRLHDRQLAAARAYCRAKVHGPVMREALAAVGM